MARMVYIVQQINWNYNDEFNYPEYGTPLKAFLHRTSAEAYRKQLEYEAHRELEAISPEEENWCGNLAMSFGWDEIRSGRSEAEVCDQLATLGLPAFPLGRDYQNAPYTDYWSDDWWENAWKRLGDERAEALWHLFDTLHFFEVVEAEIEEEYA